MYAIIASGGKQYRVEEGKIIEVELLGIEKGAPVQFKEVLFCSNGSQSILGKPYISGCIVMGELLGEVTGPKVINFKYKKRKNYRRKVGHRQKYSRVKITGIKE